MKHTHHPSRTLVAACAALLALPALLSSGCRDEGETTPEVTEAPRQMEQEGTEARAGEGATGEAARVGEPPKKGIPEHEVTTLTMQVHPTIGSKCGIVAAKAYFPFDSSTLDWGDEAMLDELVTCLTAGPLKGEKVRLVGRASVKGPAAYNRDLAERRAKAVADALARDGIDRARIETVARGEKGFDRPETKIGFALQRRVDLQLADASPETVEMTFWDIDRDQRMNREEFYTHLSTQLNIDPYDKDRSGGLDEKETGDFVLGTWDEDGDGAIQRDEWGFGAKGWFPEDDRFGEFDTWDTDNDGTITGKEWGLAFTDQEIHETWDADKDAQVYDHEIAMAVFELADLDDDGWIGEKEAGEMRRWNRAKAGDEGAQGQNR